MLLETLREVKDVRRGQGRRYGLAEVLFASILALLSGARSYRQIHSFIDSRLETLRSFGISWKRPPSYTGLRHILQGVSREGLEAAFRKYSARLAAEGTEGCVYLACDGKALRGSFDHMEDRRAAEILSVFSTDGKLILAHKEIADKSNEIPAFQELVGELGLQGKLFTLDALHCQKKRFGP